MEDVVIPFARAQPWRHLARTWQWPRIPYWLAPVLLGPALGLCAWHFYELAARFGSAELAARHLAAAPNCQSAGAVGLVPARVGAPGYYAAHDFNGDGFACNTLPERFGSAELAARHLAAAADCRAARAQGLAPAYRGGPGYYPAHDRDNDGIACEPYRDR